MYKKSSMNHCFSSHSSAKKQKKTTDFSVAYADNTFLPLRRRRAKILRPFLVLIRVRKPCTFLRLRLFG